LELRGERTDLKLPPSALKPQVVVPTGAGLGYGDFTLDDETRAFLLQHLPEFKDPLTRGAAWVTLWAEILDRRVPAPDFVSSAMPALESEDTEQNIQLLVGYVDRAFWTFLTDAQRKDVGPKLEQVLHAGIDRAKSPSTKATYFAGFRSIVTTTNGV